MDVFVRSQFVLVFMFVDYSGITFQGYRFRPWGEAIAWIIAVIPVSMIPLWMAIKFWQLVGTCQVSTQKYIELNESYGI